MTVSLAQKHEQAAKRKSKARHRAEAQLAGAVIVGLTAGAILGWFAAT